MTTRPYELLARFAPDGSVAGVSVRTITTVNGRDYESDPAPLSGASDPAFVAFASAFSASIVAQRDQLLLDKAALESQVTTLTSERDLARDQLQAANDSLAAMTLDRDGLVADKQTLTGQLATTTSERDLARQQLEATSESLDAIKLDRDGLATDKQALASQLVTLTSERDALQANVATRDQRISELEGQLEALLHPPGPDLTTRDGVRQFVSNARYVAETGGIYVGNQFVSTERDEIGHWFPRFYNALMWLQGDARIRAVNPSGHYPFKPKNHPPTVLTAEQVLRAYECMAWYINACFAAEAALYERLDANEPLDVVVTDTPAAWPSNQFSWQPPE